MTRPIGRVYCAQVKGIRLLGPRTGLFDGTLHGLRKLCSRLVCVSAWESDKNTFKTEKRIGKISALFKGPSVYDPFLVNSRVFPSKIQTSGQSLIWPKIEKWQIRDFWKVPYLHQNFGRKGRKTDQNWSVRHSRLINKSGNHFCMSL